MEYVIRFILGGMIVSIFAVVGDLFRPRSLAGIFGAAPTVGLATLGLGFAKGEAAKIAVEGPSMIAGAVAMGFYALLTSYLLLKKSWSSLPAALLAYAVWLAVAFGLWFIFLR